MTTLKKYETVGNLKRKDLTEDQKEIIRKKTQSILMFIGCIVTPQLILLWARCYGLFIVFTIISFIFPAGGWILSSIISLRYSTEWAFNNSTGYLRKLV